MTVSEDCTNGQNIKASYELTYTTDSGTFDTACVVNGTACSNGVCHHELQSNVAESRCQPPVSQFSSEGVTVSLTARDIVGISNPAVSRSISEFSLQFWKLTSHETCACLVWVYLILLFALTLQNVNHKAVQMKKLCG